MIKTDIISGNVLRIAAPDKLKTDDFRQIAPQVDSIISRYGKVRLLIDASGFNGWENIAAFENHAGFVKNHQQKVDRIAVIVAHDWHALTSFVTLYARARRGGAMATDLLEPAGRCSGCWPHDSMVRSPAAPSPIPFS